ncbi:MAG TPA: hypothetical protein VF407_06110, partial [Polyangiaceae bacterium]
STAAITRLLALATKPAKGGKFGRGIEVGAGASAGVDASAFVGNAESAFVVDAYANATIRQSVLRGSGSGGVTGFGLLVVDNASVALSGSWVRDTAGVGLAFGGAAFGSIDTTAVLDNDIGIYADSTTSITETDVVPDSLSSATVDVVSSTSFVGNTTRVSADAIPLPGANTGL